MAHIVVCAVWQYPAGGMPIFRPPLPVYINPIFVNHATGQAQLGPAAGANGSQLQPGSGQCHQTCNVHVGQVINITNQHHGNPACCGTRSCYPLGGGGGGSGGMGCPESCGVAGHSHHSPATCFDSQCRFRFANVPVAEHHCSRNYHVPPGRAGLARSPGHGAHFGSL